MIAPILFLSALGALDLSPAPREVHYERRGNFTVTAGTALVLPDQPTAEEEALAELLRHAFGHDLLTVEAAQFGGRGPAIYLGEQERHASFEQRRIRQQLGGATGLLPGGYFLRVWRSGVAVVGADPAGTFAGVQTLLNIIEEAGAVWPAMQIRDWPNLQVRGVLVHRPLSEAELRLLARLKCNFVLFDSPDFHRLEDGAATVWAQTFAHARALHMETAAMFRILDQARPLLYAAPAAVEGETRVEPVLLRGEERVPLSERNILETVDSPVRVEVSGFRCEPGTDYVLEAGVLEAPYNPLNAPWVLRRVPGGAIPSGATVQVRYSFAPEGASALCPHAPEAAEAVRDALEMLVGRLQPDYIHLGMDEIERLNSDLRCAQHEKEDAGMLAAAVQLVVGQLPSGPRDTKLLLWTDKMQPGPAREPALAAAPALLPVQALLMPRVTPDEGGPAIVDWAEAQGRAFLPLLNVRDGDHRWLLERLRRSRPGIGLVVHAEDLRAADLEAALAAAW